MNQFRQYVMARHGRDAWGELAAAAEVPDEQYRLAEVYPDEQMDRLVREVSRRWSQPSSEVLEEFGAFVAPALLRVYAPLVKPGWRTLELIERTEETIHTVVRRRTKGARPPALITRRVSPTVVEMDYASPRRMCDVARGVARGLAQRFSEEIRITEPECMHRGDERCRMVFERVESVGGG